MGFYEVYTYGGFQTGSRRIAYIVVSLLLVRPFHGLSAQSWWQAYACR